MNLESKTKTILCSLAIAFSGLSSASAETSPSDLGEMSIQQLINLQVTSVSKSSQKLLKSAAAIFVLTQEDIRRSGATSIADMMRLVPGLNVGRINSNTWGVSSRGFNEIFANKLLVLIDGRTVYTPLFSGVFWDEQDVILEDIERIEVIRGPGATLWGANAVNGVINIITKDARDTVGGLISGGGGSEEKLFGTTRYGAKLDDTSALRVYGKYFDRDNAVMSDSSPADDSWNQARGGFRYDKEVDGSKHYTLQGDSYYGEEALGIFTPTLTPPYSEMPGEGRYVNGTNLLGRFSNKLSETQEYQLQMYYDRIQRADLILDEHRDTFDIDFQHRFSPLENHDFIYGFGYRYYRDDLNGTFTASFDPDNRNVDQLAWFLQDDISLGSDELHLILGSKFEHNEFTGLEFQPNARLLWNATEHSSVWTAVSRASRTPSRAHEDIRLNLATLPGELAPNVISVFGNRDLDSEQMIAYEAGFRSEVTSDASIDIALFYNDYEDLLSVEPGTPRLELEPFPPHGLVPFQFMNLLDGETYGAEVALDWRVMKWWRFVGSYSYVNMELDREAGSQDTISVMQEDETPDNQFVLRNHFDLPHDTEFDVILRYNDNIPAFQIDSYFELDLRAAWRPSKDLEIAVVGQNLLADEHREYEANFVTLEEVSIQRGVYGKVTWRF